MIELELSYTWGNDDATFAALTAEFSQQHAVKVKLRRLDWSTAWVDLFTMVSHGTGSDVSAIGSSWVSTLAKLDALRPFKPEEVTQMGGASAFAAPSWDSTKVVGDIRTWSIPWIGWMYVIFYRKDLLQSVGINPSTAFASPAATQETLLKLEQSTLEIPWLVPDSAHPYVDFLHTAAPWVWTAGGEFINATGNKALFDQPEAISGLVHWLNTLRTVRKPYQRFSVEECRKFIRNGQAAASLVDINMAHTILNREITNIEEENVGFANTTDIPWMGGANFVIWDHIHAHPERERAAVELVRFLTQKAASLRWLQNEDLLPLRKDALEESFKPGNPLRETVMQAAAQGRSYANVSHWRRIEAQLSLELGLVVQQLREDPTADPATVLHSRLAPLARRLNIVLEK